MITMTHNEQDWNPNDYQGRTLKQYQHSAKEAAYALGGLALLILGGLIYWIITIIGMM